MSLNFTKYVRLWPFVQFVGLELLAGGLIYQRWHADLGALVASVAWLASAGSFAYVVNKDGLGTLTNIRRALQALGYAAMLVGLFYGLLAHPEQGTILAYVGDGVAMAGFTYDSLYP